VNDNGHELAAISYCVFGTSEIEDDCTTVWALFTDGRFAKFVECPKWKTEIADCWQYDSMNKDALSSTEPSLTEPKTARRGEPCRLWAEHSGPWPTPVI
jgi:hypothetical protein